MTDYPEIYFTLPKFGPIPSDLPLAIPPPAGERSIRAPFGIDPKIYHAVLRPEVPIVFASVYIVTVIALNAYNAQRKEKNGGKTIPWWVARTRLWHWAVVLHNALLTVYSGVTFLAMLRAASQTWPGYSHDTGLAGLADAFCKINGPRGFGDAATYNTTLNIWESKNSLIHMGYNGVPDTTDVGRLWNEGLSFWGWWFYLSKFYEVIDTLVILAKGKRSPTLQTYHHAGAMMSMWAGIRYMSPPIWMFVFINSFIHTMMYTYFTLSALEIRVPNALKRTLTTMQIMQLIWGSLYAGTHLFLQYDIPVSTSYQVASIVSSAVAGASSAASSAAVALSSTVSEIIATPTPTGDMIALAKKLLLRAVGEEGIAELVTNKYGAHLSPGLDEKIEAFNEETVPQYETRWRTDLTKIDCLDTSGEAFAIYFNLLYLIPLIFLFVRFFIKAYTSRGQPSRKAPVSDSAKNVVESSKTAGKKTVDTIEKAGKKVEDTARKDAQALQQELRKDVEKLKNGVYTLEKDIAARKKGGARGDSPANKSTKSEKQSSSTSSEKKSEKQSSSTSSEKSEIKSSSSSSEKNSQRQSSSTSSEKKSAENDDKTYAEAVVEGEPEAEADKDSSSTAQPAVKQDATLAATQPTRPGAVAEDSGAL